VEGGFGVGLFGGVGLLGGVGPEDGGDVGGGVLPVAGAVAGVPEPLPPQPARDSANAQERSNDSGWNRKGSGSNIMVGEGTYIRGVTGCATCVPERAEGSGWANRMRLPGEAPTTPDRNAGAVWRQMQSFFPRFTGRKKHELNTCLARCLGSRGHDGCVGCVTPRRSYAGTR
jgi:hypothetical protein